MEIDKYYQYLEFEKKGLKKQAKTLLYKFIDSFSNYEEKRKWTFEFLPFLEKNQHSKIRHELYENIVFPVLLDGYNNHDVISMHWMAKTINNIYSSKILSKKIGDKTDVQIIKECYKIDPLNEEIVKTFLELEIRFISFSQHEWPSAILFGMNGASLEECLYIKNNLNFIRLLDKEKKYSKYINDYELKLDLYINRLKI